MFTRKEQLIARTGKNKVGRFEFLKLLTNEFKTSKSKEAKTQVLANLVNFAYDPINYEYLRKLRVIDLFLYLLSEDDKDFVRFSIGGICNLCLDPQNKDYIIHSHGVQAVSSLLTSSDEETVLSAITTLMFLITPFSKPLITSPEIIESMIYFSNSSNIRIKNLATIFLTDYCSDTNVKHIKEHPTVVPVSAIPLPQSVMNSRLFTLCARYSRSYSAKLPSKLASDQNLKPGDSITITKSITEDDILSFAKLTDDFNPIHITSPKNIVHGAFLNGLVSGVIGTKLPGAGTIVVEQIIRYPKPCYAGDTVSITVEIVTVRKIIKCKYRCIANMERIVLEGEAKLMASNAQVKKISFTQ
ncbi:armadillo repeat-containing protein 7 [Neodiprion lecontei]|uniref:Armadillo repeat-containing protein 7 n=1 Tax=Neodiprion lecontei TaxID=441921 RepID=A0ABM3FET5_NEOLC|nr:armadillo repeat-containing protein 7 [Neodiprion lecontei]